MAKVVVDLMDAEGYDIIQEDCIARHRSGGLLVMGTWARLKYCLDGATSAPTDRIWAAKHHFVGLRRTGMRGWKCYSYGTMSALTNQIIAAEHHSYALYRMGTRE